MNILITGGVGFIGTNCAISFAKDGHDVTVMDNFYRPGVQQNAEYLQKNFPNITIVKKDVREKGSYRTQIQQADVIIHLAGQTAVTTSITDPANDFDININGSFNLLEGVRLHNPQAIVLYSSTNKVYGDLSHHSVELDEQKQQYINHTCPQGVDENEKMDLISPYGCSKGTADFYMLDYARIYGLKTVVFRQSCIYGPFQIGVEDQGWVAHFSKQILSDKPITIFGDGLQVRDLLYVGDLIGLYKKAITQIDIARGQAFNAGGGVRNSYSLIQVLDILHQKTGKEITLERKPERAGDQKWFVSANSKAKEVLNWEPTTQFETGVERMIEWQRKANC